MSVEHLKAELARLREDADGFYAELAAPMTKLDELSGRWATLANGSSRDLTQVADAFGKVRTGFHAIADGLIDLSLAVDAYASGL